VFLTVAVTYGSFCYHLLIVFIRLCADVLTASTDAALESLCEGVGYCIVSCWSRTHCLPHSASHDAMERLLSRHGCHRYDGQGIKVLIP